MKNKSAKFIHRFKNQLKLPREAVYVRCKISPRQFSPEILSVEVDQEGNLCRAELEHLIVNLFSVDNKQVKSYFKLSNVC